MDNSSPNLPQPVDYGLTYQETFNGLYLYGERKFRDELPDCGFTKFTYKHGEWVPFSSRRAVPMWLALYTAVFVVYATFNDIPGGWKWNNPRAFGVFFAAMVFPGVILLGIVHAVDHSIRESHARRNPSESLLAFRRALSEYKLALIAARRKRSYWEALDGYQFEIATAKVLGLHRFNPTLTGGPADGGIDIKVHRDGMSGVVQCKAHATPIAPHAVRDLFGVMHHSRAGFGIVASRAGFTAGAVEFAKGKSIFLIGISELVTMAEGKDVFDFFFRLVAVCPKCGGSVFDMGTKYQCERVNAVEEPCSFEMDKVICQQPIDRVQIQKLVTKRRTDLLTHFVRPRTGEIFASFLVLDEEGDWEFEKPSK